MGHVASFATKPWTPRRCFLPGQPHSRASPDPIPFKHFVQFLSSIRLGQEVRRNPSPFPLWAAPACCNVNLLDRSHLGLARLLLVLYRQALLLHHRRAVSLRLELPLSELAATTLTPRKTLDSKIIRTNLDRRRSVWTTSWPPRRPFTSPRENHLQTENLLRT